MLTLTGGAFRVFFFSTPSARACPRLFIFSTSSGLAFNCLKATARDEKWNRTDGVVFFQSSNREKILETVFFFFLFGAWVFCVAEKCCLVKVTRTLYFTF